MLNIRKTSQQGQLTFGLDKLDLLTKRRIRSTNVKLTVDSPIEVRQIHKLIPLLRKSRKIDLRLKDMGESDSSQTLIKHLGRLNYVKDLSIQAPQIIPFETYTPLLRSNYRYKLKKLSMDFIDYDEIPDKVFVTLGRFLKNSRMIEDLSMNFEPSFYSFASSTNMSVYLLSKGIRKLRMLKKFHIGLRKTVELNDKCLIILNKSLRNKTKLTDLSIDLSKNKQVANEGFRDLSSLLNASSQLKRVNLIFNGCDLISNEALINLKSNYDLTKSNFESFGISLLGCERIGDEGAETIVQMIKSNSNLKSLKIDLNKSSITNKTLIGFSEEFGSLKNIETIELNFPICYSINDDALKALQQSLTTIKTLKNFKIDFRGCSRISDRGIEKLCEGLSSLSQLTNLGLNFSWGDHISNASLEHLNHAFQKLTSLQTLSLDFHFLTPVPKSYMVTDTGIGHLGQGIGKLTSLKKLRLNFEMCMITDQSMIHIKNALLPLSELKEFTLNVNGCTFVTHKGFVLLQEPFIKLKNLEYIKLDIERCHHIVSRAIAQVKSAATHIPTLIINR